jgi:hypothetical protein
LAEGVLRGAASRKAAGLEKKADAQSGQIFEEDKAMIYK